MLLTEAVIREALPMPAAIDAAERAFVAIADGALLAPQRTVLSIGDDPGGTTLVMPAHLPGTGLATKVVSLFPGNASVGLPTIHGLVLCLDEDTGVPTALLDGTFLTAWRTGAATGAATRHLARAEAKVGLLLGAGAQAATQVLALDAARELEVIRIWSRDSQRARSLADAASPSVRCRLEVVEEIEAALDGAEVVASATSALAPFFPAGALAPGAHLTSVGSFTPQMREIDPVLASRARVFVDDRVAALEEAGELLTAIELGHTRAEDWTLLGDVIAGRSAGREWAEEVTWFKSVGHAAQDVTAAAAVLQVARKRGLGSTVQL